MGVSNDTYAWFVRNRIVSLEMTKDDLIDYFSATDETLGDVLWPEGGFFAGVTIAADGNDKFKIGGLSGIDGAVGGDLLNLTARQSDVEGVQFENANLVDYHVGLQDARLPEEIVVNPKDALPNWTRYRHIVGMQDVPDAVNDNGDGTITFTIDTLTEASVSNAGRQVYVYMATLPKGAITNALAIELLTVAWTGGNNKITTVGDFEQASVSTTPGDYVVVLVGPHVLRNTDISGNAAYAYVGTVQGATAGNPPSVFDVSGQRMLSASSSLLWQITRVENVPPNRLKIDVKSLAGESGVNQISVTDSGSGVKFSVDEAGNVVIEGDLDVKGTTTTRDVDQVNAYNAYFDSLDAGNADTDTHGIQGEWTHTSSGGGITAFAIDGDTGRVGIGGTYDSAAALLVTGKSIFAGDVFPDGATRSLGGVGAGEAWKFLYLSAVAGEGVVGNLVPSSLGVNLGSSSYPWLKSYFSITAGNGIATHLVPAASTLSLGIVSRPWQRLYLSDAPNYGIPINLVPAATTGIELGNTTYKWEKFWVSDAAAKGIATNLVPATTALELGNTSYPWKKLWVSIAAGEGVAVDLVPATVALDLGNTSYPWQKLYLATGAGEGVATHLVPALALDLGNANYPWRNLFLSTAGGGGVATNLVPATTALELGNTGYPWKKFWLSSAADEGVATHLVPVSLNNFDLGNSSYKWRSGYFSSTVEADQLRATGDTSGGGANTVTFTSTVAGLGAANVRVVKGSTVGDNDGWLKIYVVGVAKYIPYYSSA